MPKIINRILIAGFTDGDIARCTNNDKIFPSAKSSTNSGTANSSCDDTN